MPVLSWGHSHYWAGSTGGGGTPDPPLGGVSAAGGYTPWMTTITAGSLGGGLQPVYDWIVTRGTREKETR